jgi:hypothetical protein
MHYLFDNRPAEISKTEIVPSNGVTKCLREDIASRHVLCVIWCTPWQRLSYMVV